MSVDVKQLQRYAREHLGCDLNDFQRAFIEAFVTQYEKQSGKAVDLSVPGWDCFYCGGEGNTGRRCDACGAPKRTTTSTAIVSDAISLAMKMRARS